MLKNKKNAISEYKKIIIKMNNDTKKHILAKI